jgi:hypothetical protein
MVARVVHAPPLTLSPVTPVTFVCASLSNWMDLLGVATFRL